MEDETGAPSIVLRVRLEKRGDAIRLDYDGTAAQRPMPLEFCLRRNAFRRVLRAAGGYRPAHFR